MKNDRIYNISVNSVFGAIIMIMDLFSIVVRLLVWGFWEREGGTPHRHGYKESYKDLDLKILMLYQLSYQEICIKFNHL